MEETGLVVSAADEGVEGAAVTALGLADELVVLSALLGAGVDLRLRQPEVRVPDCVAAFPIAARDDFTRSPGRMACPSLPMRPNAKGDGQMRGADKVGANSPFGSMLNASAFICT